MVSQGIHDQISTNKSEMSMTPDNTQKHKAMDTKFQNFSAWFPRE